jgi:hypothetical protein
VQQRRQQRAITRLEPHLLGAQLPFQHRELMAQREESRRGESHPPPLAEPCVSLSAYTVGLHGSHRPAGRFGAEAPVGEQPWERREASAISSRARCGRRRSRLYLRMAQRTR